MSSTPDYAPTPSAPEYTDKEREVFSVDQLEQWRAYQKDLLNEFRSRATGLSDTYVREFTDGIDEGLDTYLAAHGVANDSPNYAEVRDLFRNASIDRINEEQWYTSPASRGEDADDTKSQRDLFGEKIRERFKTTSDPDDDPEADPTSDSEAAKAEKARELQEAREAVERAREEWATVSAKRQGKLFSRNNAEHAQIHQDYNEEVNELGRLELADIINDDEKTDDEKNVAVIEYLFKEQAKLRELTTEKLKGTKISKFIKWMNKGGIVKRVLKGVGLGAAAGVAGTLLAGAAGAALVTTAATTAAVAATRFARGYALMDRDKRGMASADEAIDKDMIASQLPDTDVDGDVFDKAGSHFNELFENDTRHEQTKRRRAVAMGLGTVALGAGLGYGLHFAAEAVTHHSPQLLHPFGDNADGSHHSAHHSYTQGGETSPNQPVPHVSAHELPSSRGYEHPWTWAKDAIDKHAVSTHKTPEAWLHELSDRAQKAGHNVEWHGSGKHEWIRIDGKEDRAAIDVLRQFAKK